MRIMEPFHWLMGVVLLAQESNPSQLVRLCGAHPGAARWRAIQNTEPPLGRPRGAQWGRRPLGGSIGDTFVAKCPGRLLELVELLAGCASGTHGKDRDSNSNWLCGLWLCVDIYEHMIPPVSLLSCEMEL